MKKILAIIILLVLAYTGFWYYQAEKAKHLIGKHLQGMPAGEPSKPSHEHGSTGHSLSKVDDDHDADDEDSDEETKTSLVAQADEEESPATPNEQDPDESSPGSNLTYDSLGVSGYPFSYEVVINNPKMSKGKSQINVNGNVTIGTNLWGTEYWISTNGDTHVTGAPGSQEHTLVFSGDQKARLDVPNPHPFHALMHPFKDFPKELYAKNFSPAELWKLLNKAVFEFKNFTISDKDQNPQQILSLEKAFIEFEKEFEKDHSTQIKYNVDVKGLDATNTAGYFQQKKVSMFGPHLTMLPAKTDFKFKGQANFPENLSLESLAQFPKLSFEISDFEMSNKFGTSNLKTNFFVNHKDNHDKALHFDFAADSETNKDGYNNIVKEFVAMLRKEVNNADQSKVNPHLKKLMQCCEADLQNVIPHYDELGKINFDIDFDLNEQKEDSGANLYKANLKQFDYTTKLYGIKTHGEASVNGSPKGHYIVNWANFKNMIQDISAYYNRIQPVLVALVTEEEAGSLPKTISSNLTNQAIEFFRYVSDQPEKDDKDLQVTINFDDPQNIKIGTRTVPEVTAAAQNLQKEYMKELPVQPPVPVEKKEAPVKKQEEVPVEKQEKTPVEKQEEVPVEKQEKTPVEKQEEVPAEKSP